MYSVLSTYEAAKLVFALVLQETTLETKLS